MSTHPNEINFPNLASIESQAKKLNGRIHLTPVHTWDTPVKYNLIGGKTKSFFKLELLQRTGTFKIRGALSVLDNLSEMERGRGVVAGTGGNHGVAVAYAARTFGVNAKIIVPKTINSYRLNAIKQFGAEVLQVECISEVLNAMQEVAQREKRTIMHPYENPSITLGTGTLGLEFLKQVPDLDVVIVPIGGGGLASGVSAAVKQHKPGCKVYGVEPKGANSMYQSLALGKPVSLTNGPKSIADSLCAPCATPYSFSVCQKYLDDVVLIEDQEMQSAMSILFHDLKLAVEPAGAAATAALLGPLKERCTGLNIGVIVCGSNIDMDSFYRLAGVPAN